MDHRTGSQNEDPLDLTRNPTVFVTQVPHRRTRSGSWIARINISPASDFGKIRVMIDHQESIAGDTKRIVAAFHAALQNYSYERGDCLLMTGDPTVIAIASAVVGEYTDKFRILKWDADSSSYNLVEIHLNTEPEEKPKLIDPLPDDSESDESPDDEEEDDE